MNLKEIYEIFYPGKVEKYSSVWKREVKYRSKKNFFEEAFPTELRWLNIKLWNDKARRSRFFADSKTEKNYVSALNNYILQNPMEISRMENKCCRILKNDLFPHRMNHIFFQLVKQEQISFSSALKQYLIDEDSGVLKEEWGNVLTFLIFYAIFPEKINQLYIPYLHSKENTLSYNTEEQTRKDSYLFQYEYPPDMNVHKPGEWVTHNWVIKNTGKIPWEHRRFECTCPPDWLNEKSKRIEIARVIYPGDTVEITVHFRAPETPGHYVLHWGMKNRKGDFIFSDKVGLGLHFTVLEEDREPCEQGKNNYQVLEERPAIPATLTAGKLYEHNWVIENTGTVTWEDYYCECINGDVWGYAKNELRIPMKKKIEPGERVSIQIEFVTPPIEGCYKLLINRYRNATILRALQCAPKMKMLYRLPYFIFAQEATSFFRLPLGNLKISGIKIKEIMQKAQDIDERVLQKDNVKFGQLLESEQSSIWIGCAQNTLTKHALIVGMPGTGKTTFSVNLLLQMYRRGIPFLAIEPTKTEYRALIDRIPDLQIFTPGKNKVSPFVINPFLPPKGITVEQYIPSLLSAFKAAFFSERYYMEFRDKIRDINTMCAYMNAVNQWLEKQDIKEGQEKRIQLCNCVKIKYLRKVLQEKEFRLSQKDREKILQVLVK